MLASSRSARRRSAREDRRKALFRLVRFLVRATATICGIAFDLALLVGTPLAYLAASFAVLDLPAGWLFRHAAVTGASLELFAAALLVSALGVFRAMQASAPVVPVRPKFARAMLAAGWIAALFLTVADLSKLS
jgi:ABC-type antimicrobial peptide transport system permease subunit